MEDEDSPEPEQPDALYLLRRAKSFGVPLFNGSYFDSPYILQQEISIAIELEAEFETANNLSLLLQAKSIGEQNAYTSNESAV